MDSLPSCPDIDRIRNAPYLPLGKWPTPLERVETYLGPIWVKRDDLSGFGRGGVKTRKIEHLIGYLEPRGYREVITVVANITNLAHDLAPALAKVGMRPAVLAVDEPSLPAAIRAEFFREAGASVSLLGKSQLMAAVRLACVAVRSSRTGKTFVALPSLSHPSAVAGAAQGFLEMVQQLQQSGEYPETVFITVASGATYAGFLLAERALAASGMPSIRVIGVRVHQHRARPWILNLMRWSKWKLGLSSSLALPRIELIDHAIEGGFGRFSPETVQTCRDVQDRYNLRIDPIFGGKTWSAMDRWLAHHRPRGPVVYWHCGYTPDWERMGKLCPT